MISPRRSATLQEIAARLDLNVGTVSRALNGSRLVKDETKAEILRVAAELQYKPNRNARNLVQRINHNRFIAILIPNIVHRFFFEVIRGVVDELNRASFNLMVFNVGNDRPAVLGRALDEVPEGVMVFGDGLSPAESDTLRDRRIPFLYVDYQSDYDPCAYFDNLAGGRMAAQYLIDRGVRRPLYIGTSVSTQQQDLRFRGFSEELSRSGIREFAARYITLSEENAREATDAALTEGLCDGLFFFCDEMAYGGLKALRARGKAMPLIGFDDLPVSELVGLTTVRQDAARLGREGALMLLNFIQTGGWYYGNQDQDMPPVTQLKLIPTLTVRNS